MIKLCKNLAHLIETFVSYVGLSVQIEVAEVLILEEKEIQELGESENVMGKITFVQL